MRALDRESIKARIKAINAIIYVGVRGWGIGIEVEFRRIRQCTGVTLLTVNTSPREHITVYMIANIIADNISLSQTFSSVSIT